MKQKQTDSSRKIIVSNKEAFRLFEIYEKVEAGIVLMGTEVKAIRTNSINLTDAYAYCKNGEAWLANLSIPPYKFGNRENHVPLREKKLLLNKREIQKLGAAVQEKGKTLIPLSMYFKQGKIKIELGIGKGKKLHDKRASLKEKEAHREMAKALKKSNR